MSPLKIKDNSTGKVVITIDEEGKEKFDDEWLEKKKKEKEEKSENENSGTDS